MNGRWDIDNLLKYIANRPTVRRPPGNQSCFHGLYYKDCICALDLEASRLPESNHSFVYMVTFGCDDLPPVHFRTLFDFADFVDELQNASSGSALPTYVHNLQYDFQFLAGILSFDEKKILCGKAREVIKAYSEPLELRCSYKLTGQSLDDLTSDLNVQHKKKSAAEYDHNKLRYPWTELSTEEMEYVDNDVIGLIESIKVINREYGDNVYTMPITQTGYSRREVKRRMRNYPWQKMDRMKYDVQIYDMMRAAMRGGNAIGNRYIEGDILENVETWDMSSAYLAAVLYADVPMAAWRFVENPDADLLFRYTMYRRIPFLATIKIKNLRLKRIDDPAPYIMYSKTYSSAEKAARSRDVKKRVNTYAGRILNCPDAILTVTDIDFRIILKHYDFDEISVIEMATNFYGKIPEPIREYTKELYVKKTVLKGKNKIRYNAIKREANAIFGMMAEDPAKVYYTFKDGQFIPLEKDKGMAIAEKQERAYNTYAWGVWITATVREWIQEIIDELCSRESGYAFCYCDTDGVKTPAGNGDVFSKFNEKMRELSIEERAYAKDSSGRIHYCGCFEREKNAQKFVTLGTKKYAEEVDGKLEITLAGVKKSAGAAELGSIDLFREGFTFRDAGGREAIYNDLEEVLTLDIDGHELDITRNVTLNKISFTLGGAGEMRRLSLYPELWMKTIGVIK